ncbi:MAG: sialate O-acetylesterase [Kiritimatiellae bacterium]|nr:sialate O-acetylesterase [Kiritimatiellia bacterium]
MKIEAGLFDHMVLQRNQRNVSEANFSGACAASGPVLATVRRGKGVVKGFASVPVGKAARGRIKGCLKGVPAGGPYVIELLVRNEKLVVRDVLVGDVWLLGGQSNMQGCGLFPEKRLPADPQVRAFFMDDRWAVAKDPIHNMWACVDQVHIDLCGGVRPVRPPADWGVCPGPAFGIDMRRRTGVPQGLIACAHGGTSMTQWDPRRKGEGGTSLYGALVRRLVKNGRCVAGMIWYQGCSDANALDATLYTKRMQAFVAALRRDCADKTLPVAIVQIGRVIGWEPSVVSSWNSIQEQERRLPQAIRNLATVPVIDLPLDDMIHISGEGQKILGKRLAQAMQALRGDRKAGPPPISLEKIELESVRGQGVAVVEFKNVVGKLRAGSRPSGFAIVNQSGSANHFDIQLAGRRVRVRSILTLPKLREAVVHYGYGADPVCNIVDEAGRSLPVFGGGMLRAVTPFVQKLRVSAFQPSADKLDTLELPAALDSLGLATRSFAGALCNLHQEIDQHGGRDEVVWFACRFSCPEAMRLALLFGYDGPLKVWVDGKQVFHDPDGVNPASTEKGKTIIHAAQGDHEALIALGTNHGAAWGINLFFERLDIAREQLCKGPGHYEMPKLLG